MGVWLSDLGFVYGNPFAHVEADRERAFLPRFFVPVAGYDHIAGNDTVVVFAPRGSGKSALRVMLASECAPQDARGSYLAVEFTNFDTLSQKRARGEPVLIDDYVVRLLQAGVRTFWQILDGPSQQAMANETDTAYRLERAQYLPGRADAVDSFCGYVLSGVALSGWAAPVVLSDGRGVCAFFGGRGGSSDRAMSAPTSGSHSAGRATPGPAVGGDE